MIINAEYRVWVTTRSLSSSLFLDEWGLASVSFGWSLCTLSVHNSSILVFEYDSLILFLTGFGVDVDNHTGDILSECQ